MKSKKIFLAISFLFINLISFSQQIGNGAATGVSDFNIELPSGFYQGYNATGQIEGVSWNHLLNLRHSDPGNNHQLQIASTYAENDRLFFRKFARATGSSNPDWHEIATRDGNTFNGNQIINGNVGIGTTSPSSLLTLRSIGDNAVITLNRQGQWASVASGLKLTTDDAGTDYWNFGMLPNSTNTLHIGTNGNSSMSVLTNGYVGIGTTTPIEKLHVLGNIVAGNANGQEGSLFLGNSSHGIKRTANNVEMYTHGADGNLLFSTFFNQEKMRIIPNGNVGIGTTTPDEKLTVKGKIHAQEVKVDLQGACAPDYVFQKYYTGKSTLKSDYVMPTLAEIESFTKKNHHLPNVPSAQEVQQNGVSLGTMSIVLLQKVEELTLYAIEQNKYVIEQNKKLMLQQEELELLKKENENFKSLAERLSSIEKVLTK